MRNHQAELDSLRIALNEAFGGMSKDEYQRFVDESLEDEGEYIFFFPEEILSVLGMLFSPRFVKTPKFLDKLVSSYVRHVTEKEPCYRKKGSFISAYVRTRDENSKIHLLAANDHPGSSVEQKEKDNYYAVLSVLYSQIKGDIR